MFELVQFLFSSFWYWLGGLVYLGVIAAALTDFNLVEIKHDKEMNEEEFMRLLVKYNGKKKEDEDE